jgi:hypothetical protein
MILGSLLATTNIQNGKNIPPGNILDDATAIASNYAAIRIQETAPKRQPENGSLVSEGAV